MSASVLRPCPFCASVEIDLIKSEHDDNDPYSAVCKCGASTTSIQWNNRPLENKLKQAIDIFLKGARFVIDQQATHRANEKKMKQCYDDVVKLLKGK